MSNAKPYYLTASDDDSIPHDRLKPGRREEELPARTLEEDNAKDPLPEGLSIERRDEDEGSPAMQVRLTADEPDIPDGTLLEKKKLRPGDDVELPQEFIREERRMPRLH